MSLLDLVVVVAACVALQLAVTVVFVLCLLGKIGEMQRRLDLQSAQIRSLQSLRQERHDAQAAENLRRQYLRLPAPIAVPV